MSETATPWRPIGRYIRDTVAYNPRTGMFSLHVESGDVLDGQWLACGDRKDITHHMTQQQLHDMAVFDLGMRLPIQDAPRAD